MKAKIHPNYIEDLKITCSCGNVIIAGSTKKEVRTEICSACHPFYTGHQKLIDTAGRVDKFLAKVKKAQKMKEKEVEIVDAELEEIFHHEETRPSEEAEQEAPAAPKKKAAAEKAPAKAKTAKAGEKTPAKKTPSKKPAASKKTASK